MQATNKNDEPNYFGQLLSVLSEEELIRIRWRFQREANHRMVEIMTDEIEEREAIERETYAKQAI